MSKHLTVAEAARRLGCSATAVRQRAEDGYIASIRMGKAIRIMESEVARCAQISYFGITSKEKSSRIKAGMAKAELRGVAVGRPRKSLDLTEVFRLRNEGMSWRAVAKTLGIGTGTAIRALQTYNARTPTERDHQCETIPIREAERLLRELEISLRPSP